MIAEVKIPEVGESITEGYLVEWKVKEGDYVQVDQDLFELETDKITLNIAAEVSGVISLKVEVDSTVQIGQVVATIDTEAEAATEKPPQAEPVPEKEADEVQETASVEPPDLASLSPSVRPLVLEHNLDPADIPGTGKGGRITEGDVLNYLKSRETVPPEKAPPEPPEPRPAAKTETTAAPASAASSPKMDTGERTTRKKMSPLRQRLAQRLVQVQQSAAILNTFNEADMSRVIEMRQKFKDEYQKRYGVKLGFMSFFVKAVVDALQLVPAVNTQIDGTEIIQNHYYDIGVAVSTEKGLVVPVIRDADRLSFAEIELKIAELANKARERTLTLDDLQGGVYTISNGGIFGSLLSTPILNPPQSGILGLHAIKKRPIALPDDTVAVRPMMYLAMSYDHRLIDGREAVTFLKRIVECIEDPERIMLNI